MIPGLGATAPAAASPWGTPRRGHNECAGPAEEVWHRLVRIGQGRGGFNSLGYPRPWGPGWRSSAIWGRCSVGVTGDSDFAADVEVLARGVAGGLAELARAEPVPGDDGVSATGAVTHPVAPGGTRTLLADGTVVRLRELSETDAGPVAALYRELPVSDRYLRFFGTPAAGQRPAARAARPAVPARTRINRRTRSPKR